MKKIITTIILVYCINLLFAYQYPAILKPNNTIKIVHKLNELGISIDNVDKDGNITIYIDDEDLKSLQNLGLNPIRIPDKAKIYADKLWNKTKDSKNPMDVYYTYDEYTQIMQNIANQYPDICHLESAGQSVQGRELWFMKISDNVNIEEDEPEVKLISTMHGDEPVGFVNLVKLIQLLTSQYGTNPRITNIVDNTELWINPLMNPDGYVLHQRANANNVDLNRTFPDIVLDQNNNTPDGREPEVQHIMNFAATHTTDLSMNFHTGSLVINYPWDRIPDLSPDNDLLIHLSLAYASHNPEMSNSQQFENGITNGFAWYEADGSMQDWNLYFENDIDLTAELDNIKWPPVEDLPSLWTNNKESILSYIEEAQIGIRGIVSDPSGNPLDATIQIANNVQLDNTDPDVGDYHRLLLPGTYQVTYSATGFVPQTMELVVNEGNATVQNVILEPAANILFTGTVKNNYSVPINNAAIKLLNTDYPTVYTDSEGHFSIENVLENNYQISITADNYVTYLANITINEENNDQTFYLGPPAFSDDFENGTLAWELDDTWGTQSEDNNTFLSDSPQGDYQSEENSSATLTEPIDLANSTYAFIFFDAKFELELNYDFVYLEASSDGNSWFVIATFTGEYDWQNYSYNLDDYIGGSLYFRFRLQSDSSVVKNGIYIDNIIINSDNYVVENNSSTNSVLNSLTLNQNYPNPFSPNFSRRNQTKISFNLRNSSQVNLSIFNIKGEKIITLINNYLQKGTHFVNWNGKNSQGKIVSSGVYFYRLKDNNFIRIKKMLIIK
jgi:hypothetical protein